MKTQIFTTQIDANNRLSELGLDSSQVAEVVNAMAAARANCTENHPSSAPGWYSWSEGSARLREVTLPKGWERKDIDQVPNVINNETRVRLTVMNTNENTGIAERTPQPTSKKGTATKNATDANQREFFEDFPDFGEATINEYRPIENQDGFVQWYLMVYSDNKLTRAEVSCPTSMIDGRFGAFSERIIVSVDDGDKGRKLVRKTTPPSVDKSEFEVTVKRKQA